MDRNALIEVLKHARESGIKTGEDNTAFGQYNSPWETETDKDIYENLIQTIRSNPDLDDFNERMFVLGDMRIRMSYETLAKHLLYRTLKVGEEQVVNELEKFNNMDATPAFNILAISGIKVEQEIDLGSGVSLVPFDFIPDCIVKECFKLTDKIIQDPRTTISVMPGTRTSESALIKKIAIKPKSHKQEEGTVYRLDTEKLYQVCDCLTLVTNSSPVPLASWTVLENWVPCSSMLQCGWGGQGFDRTNISTYKLTQKNCEDASSIIRKYFELNKNIQDLLRISLQRLNLSRRRNSPVDRAIDLGIALESLLLHDGTPDAQISFPFRLRGAWLLGQDGTSRRNYYKLFKELYELRCKAVHNGRFDTKFSKKANDLLKKGDELCIGVIAWILEHKRMPNWEGLVLDDVNRLESGKYA